jgi:alpha-mannosidase
MNGKSDMFTIEDELGRPLPTQVTADGKCMLAFLAEMPALGYRFYSINHIKSAKKQKSGLKISKNRMENKFFKVSFDKNGLIAGIYDKINRREILENGKKGNVLQAFEDRPLRNNAWDIEIYYQDKCIEISELQQVKVFEDGPLRGAIQQKRKFLDSEITQTIYIYEHLPRIDFETEIDWHQHETLLKVAFPVNIHANSATYEIPYGNIQRPTHWNTLWDMGRFEVPAQKWADLSEGDYGVSLLNNCKYGYDIRNNQMRLTLIKSPIEPDPNADIGRHRFTYALYPHRGDWRSGGTICEAYQLNYPVHTRRVPSPGQKDGEISFSFAKTDSDHVIIESVKKAEDSDDIVVRLYESSAQRGDVQIIFSGVIKAVWESNMLEKEKQPLKHEKHTVTFPVKPYEIKTLMVKFK